MSVFIVAEMSCNHMGDIQTAYEIIDAAADAGADAVKISLDDPNGGITIDCHNWYFKIRSGPWKGENLYNLYKRTATPWRYAGPLKRRAERRGMELFATVSCTKGVALCGSLGMPRYKVSSYEACDVPLIRAIMKTGKPVIVSCGADWYDAWEELQGYDASYLYCVSKYPAAIEDFDFDAVAELDGISDHSLGSGVAIAAVAHGAKIVEKHLTLNRGNGSADASFSAEPGEFKAMVSSIRCIERVPTMPARRIDRSLCKSLFAVKDIKKGEMFTDKNIGVIRPGDGLKPREYYRVLGCKAKHAIKRGTPIKESML